MAFLTITPTVGSAVTVPVAVGGATKKALEVGGSLSRAYSGGLRSTVRWEKRVWQWTTPPLIESAAAAIEAVCALGAFVTIAGDVLGGGTATVCITTGDANASATRGGARRALVLTAREV